MKPTWRPSRRTGRTVRTAWNVGDVLPHERHLLLELSLLDRLPQKPRDEGRDVLRNVEPSDAHLADDVVAGPTEQGLRVGGVLLHDAVHIARDHGRLVREALGIRQGDRLLPDRLLLWRRQRTGLPHEPDLLPVPEHRTDCEDRGEPSAVLPHQGDFFLEFAFLHGFTQEARDQDRHVLWDVKRGHSQLPDDLFWAPPEQVRGIRRILLDDSLHVARDHRRLRGERFSLLPGRVHASYAVG